MWRIASIFSIITCMHTLVYSTQLTVTKYNDSTKFYWSTNTNKAMQFANSAINLCDTNNHELYGECLKNKGVVFYFQYHHDSATYFYKKALSHFKKSNSNSGISKVLNNLGVLKMETGDYTNALKYYTQSLELATKTNDTLSVIRGTINISNIYFSLGNYTLALNSCLKNKELANKINDKYLQANYISSIYSSYKELNDINNAQQYAQQALSIYKQINDSIGIATTYTNMANIFEMNNNLSKAIELNKNALEIFKRLNYNIGIVHNQLQLGNIYRNKKQYQLSTHYFHKSIESAIAIDAKNQVKEIANELYINYLFTGDLQKSRYYQNLSDSINNIIIGNEIKSQLAEYQTKFETFEKEQKIQKLSAEKAQQELILKSEEQKRRLISAITLLISTLAVGIFVLYHYTQKQKRIELARKKAEVENRLLRVQMNPHFMFNSLNSVQSYIASNQNELAEDFLARFAQLTRDILNNSREDFIPLSDEISTLKTYLELEQQRFNHTFEFNISVSNELDEDMVKIPPMLIQPYIENAIIHGVGPLKGKGIIDIDIDTCSEKSCLRCTVQDNGIGLKASAKINKGKNHKSLGMQVTKERFNLIQQQTGKPLQAKLSDLTNTDSNKTGTKALITIPFIEN